jgi:hypothetical protein
LKFHELFHELLAKKGLSLKVHEIVHEISIKSFHKFNETQVMNPFHEQD